MSLPNDLDEELLRKHLKDLNQKYRTGLKILHEYDGNDSQLSCVEKLIPIMAAVQKIEVAAEFASGDVKDFINNSTVLRQMAETQKLLLSELLEKVREIEGAFQSRRSRISTEIDQQHEHKKMQSAYQQNKST